MNHSSGGVCLIAIWLAAATAALAAGNALARSRLGEAVVEDRAGLPCFRIKDDAWLFKTQFKFSGLGVVDETATRPTAEAPYVEAWGFNIAAGSAPLKVTRDDCFTYGVLPPAMSERTAAQPLQPGRLYSVSIEAQEAGGSIGTYGYRALFCLVPAANGVVLRSPQSQEEALAPGPQSCLKP